MRGSIGVGSTTGIGRSTGSIGTRASGTTLGAKSLGGSFSSPEARIGGNTSTFSSRGLSMFNRDAISKPTSSVINPNFGRDAKSPFARTPSLMSKSMFDIGRPVREASIGKHISKPAPRQSEFGVKLNPVNGRESVSKTARSVSLISSRPVVDISKRSIPKDSFKLANSSRKDIAIPRFKTETRINVPKREVQAFSLKDAAILWSKKDIAAKAPQPVSGEVTVPTVFKTKEVQAVKRKKEISMGAKKEKVLPKRKMRVGNMIRVLPQASPDAKLHIYADIKEAQKVVVPVIMKARRVFYREALIEAAKALEVRHKGKITIIPIEQQAEPTVSPEIQLSSGTDVKTKADKAVQAENVENNMSLQAGSIDAKTASKPTNPNKKTHEYYYFAKDKDTNKARKERIVHAFKKMIEKKENEQHAEKPEITGWDLQMALWEKPKDNELSEITRPIQKDESLKRLLDTVKFLGHVIDLQMLHNILENLIERYSAIKLTKDKDEGMKGKDAEQVYGQILSFVPASIKGQSEIGALDAGSDTSRLILLKQDGKKPKHQQIIYKEAA